jgi:cobalamin biosynthesis protein CobT
LHDKTGILTHRIQDNDDDTNVSLYGVQELAEAATYALSHARLADDADAYRYFGEVANHSADHRIEARCREVVRSIVPKTLDLQPADYLCDREIGREEVDKLPNIQRYQNDDSDDQDEQTDDSEDAREDTDTDNESTQESTEAAESDEQAESGDGDDTQSTTDDDIVESDEIADEDTEDEDSTDSDTTGGSNGGCGVHCNGRLVPFEYAPSILDDEQEREYEDELRAAYDEWSAPNNEDITSFAPPD